MITHTDFLKSSLAHSKLESLNPRLSLDRKLSSWPSLWQGAMTGVISQLESLLDLSPLHSSGEEPGWWEIADRPMPVGRNQLRPFPGRGFGLESLLDIQFENAVNCVA